MHAAMIPLKTSRLILSTPGLDDAEEMLDYYQRNRLNFQPWEPKREESYYAVDAIHTRISAMNKNMLEQTALHLLLREPDSERIIGVCGFTNIVRGPFQACHLGFSICQGFQGKGLMYEALQCVIGYVFNALALHRVMANYRPENKRSHHLLQRLGFEQEGHARSYLNIDGCWKDHILTSLINEASR